MFCCWKGHKLLAPGIDFKRQTAVAWVQWLIPSETHLFLSLTTPPPSPTRTVVIVVVYLPIFYIYLFTRTWPDLSSKRTRSVDDGESLESSIKTLVGDDNAMR